MPASLAHFFTCDDAVRIVCVSRPVSGLVKSLFKEFPSYARMGSIGPDLPYFATPVKTGIYMLLDINLPVDPFGHLLHCKAPALFACNLLATIKADLKDSAKSGDAKKQMAVKQTLAFALGYLTHIAADTIVHPVVNKLAGSFYLSEKNQTLHREIEIYQDVMLFKKLYGRDAEGKSEAGQNEWCRKEFMSKNFAGWIDLIQDSPIKHLIGGWDTDVYFRTLLQRSFLETYNNCPDEKAIESWIDGALTTMQNINHTLSPYTRTLYRPDAAKVNGFFKKTRYYNTEDPAISAAEAIRQNRKKPAPERAIGQKQSSLYGKAIQKSCRYIISADDFLTGGINYSELTRRINDTTLM